MDQQDQQVLLVSQGHPVFLDYLEQKENQVLWDDVETWEKQEREVNLVNKELLEKLDTLDLQEEMVKPDQKEAVEALAHKDNEVHQDQQVHLAPQDPTDQLDQQD